MSAQVSELGLGSALHKNSSCGKDFSRKGATTQSTAVFLMAFLCAFASLREKSFFPLRLERAI